MPYFLFEGQIEEQKDFVIKSSEVRHIKLSHKVKKGEKIQIQDSHLKRYLCQTQQIGSNWIALTPIKQIDTIPDPKIKIELYTTILKEKPLSIIIQKATELGVSYIGFFESQYSKKLFTPPQSFKKLAHWHKIAQEACKQCGRTLPPKIEMVGNLHDVIQSHQLQSKPYLLFTTKQGAIQKPKLDKQVSIFIGSEGGFTSAETQIFGNNTISLGPRTLRTETAAIAATVLLQIYYGDFGIIW